MTQVQLPKASHGHCTVKRKNRLSTELHSSVATVNSFRLFWIGENPVC